MAVNEKGEEKRKESCLTEVRLWPLGLSPKRRHARLFSSRTRLPWIRHYLDYSTSSSELLQQQKGIISIYHIPSWMLNCSDFLAGITKEMGLLVFSQLLPDCCHAKSLVSIYCLDCPAQRSHSATLATGQNWSQWPSSSSQGRLQLLARHLPCGRGTYTWTAEGETSQILCSKSYCASTKKRQTFKKLGRSTSA